MPKSIAFVDSEIGMQDHRIRDIGAARSDGAVFHSPSVRDFCAFVSESEYLCGHNIVHHDMKYLEPHMVNSGVFTYIDTLYLSPLLFPKRPHHALVKDDKLQSDELNNPLNDAKKAQELFCDEANAFHALSSGRKQIYGHLLYPFEEFRGFFKYLDFTPNRSGLENLILSEFEGGICSSADIGLLAKRNPVELAYALALIGCGDQYSVTPPWLALNYPEIENVIRLLTYTPCREGCAYCRDALDIHKGLRKIFGYESFLKYNGEPLQEKAAKAAIDGKSLLAVFPTGGGKSLTFQLPALMAGKAVHGLTVVISPLQALMKDQVDNLSEMGIVDAVTVNGLLSPVERAEAYERVASGLATILYISPEQLRSRTIEKLLLSRNVVRFVIDEAHCFSAWGQDFRVDYLYVGEFIRWLQNEKASKTTIPVSCFTATAKQKVISDIREYFKRKLDLNLELFASAATRRNLRYVVLYKETDEEKYSALRWLVEQKNCPTIVYVSRTRRSLDLASKLTADGFPARPFNGKMERQEKIANQEAFINNEIGVMVATSAFGMGVDKKDVGLVVHYDISDSLENYVQEAGRAGRDPSLEAECYVLYNDEDLNKHFMLLNQTKLSIAEIQQVWRAMKNLTRDRPTVRCSALEIARQAGWDESLSGEIETRVKTAIAALENAGFIKRGRNVPHVYATSILAKNMEEASIRISKSRLFSEPQQQVAKRIIKSLISSRSVAQAGNDDAESRVDYLADMLGISKDEVVNSVNLMRQEGLLADAQDMSAYVLKSQSLNRSLQILDRFAKLEEFVLSQIPEQGCEIRYKDWNEKALESGIAFSTVKGIKTLLYFLTIKDYIHKDQDQETRAVYVWPSSSPKLLLQKWAKRLDVCRFVAEKLYSLAGSATSSPDGEPSVEFSLVGLLNAYNAIPRLDIEDFKANLDQVAEALLYLSRIGAMRLDGGFFVLYNAMELQRLTTDNSVRYKVEHYRLLDEYYKQKIRQIHIVGEFANLMVRDYDAALRFVQDYFQIDHTRFIEKYFKGERAKQISRNITPEKYNELFEDLSEVQSRIIKDSQSRYIVIAAGPGSGKTRVLVHKLASLLLLEEVKHERLLMLTFSRAAATEFKKRLMNLIGNAAHFVEVKTFHSYCFDLLGRVGSLKGVDDVVKDAADMIAKGEVEPGKIMKSVLVIDEAQDMDQNEFALIKALIRSNDDMRIIAVGDDDQNIFAFRGSDSKYLRSLVEDYGAVKYEMEENFRSRAGIVALSNDFIAALPRRLKTTPITAVRDEPGVVEITRHTSAHFEEAVVVDVERTYKLGKACVLTNTNEEALQIQTLLHKRGLRSCLVQSEGGFRLENLAEVRYFLARVDEGLKSPVIDDDLWATAKDLLSREYSRSTCLPNCLNMLGQFESVNRRKYRQDLSEFIRESNYGDFYADEKEAVYVSTIHKAKGREFDAVYLLLENARIRNEEEMRTLYVGMTRAKDALYVHCDDDPFKGYRGEGILRKVDETEYQEPEQISIQLTHKDVALASFKKGIVERLRSGDALSVFGDSLVAQVGGGSFHAGRFSKAFAEQLKKLKGRGYAPTGAVIMYVVLWKGKEEGGEEGPILLPMLNLKKG